MPGPTIEPFADEHLVAAGELLAARHARHREAEPLLPAQYEDPAAAQAEVEALWRADDTPGAVALRDSRVVGYLVGVRKEDDVWGPNVWVDPAGHAVEAAEDIRDLYAAAAGLWVEAGRTRHYAIAPATDSALVDAWFRLSFGVQHALGIREVPDEAEFPAEVREAEARDVEALVRLSPELSRHQELAPVFSNRPFTMDEAELAREILEDLDSPDLVDLVAEVDGEIVSCFQFVPVELSSMHAGLARPDGASFLGFAATSPAARGSGVGLALTAAGFAWARRRGYDVMVTDWRMTNLLASRFWPSRGFRRTFLRLYRSIP